MHGSFLVFLDLMSTASATALWRRIILILTACYFYNSVEFIGPFCFFSGALLADLSLFLRSGRRNEITLNLFGSKWERAIYRHWPIALAVFAFFLATMPPENQLYVAWSRNVYQFFEKNISPRGGCPLQTLRTLNIIGATDRVIGAVAGILLLVAVLYSQPMRNFFSYKHFVFLGGISFPLYLLHGTFIRIPLQLWLLRILPRIDTNAFETIWEEDLMNVYLFCDTLSCRFATTIIYVVWLGCLLIAAQLWKRYVDVHGINFSRWAESVISGKKKMVDFTVPSWPNFGNIFSIFTSATDIQMGSRAGTEKIL